MDAKATKKHIDAIKAHDKERRRVKTYSSPVSIEKGRTKQGARAQESMVQAAASKKHRESWYTAASQSVDNVSRNKVDKKQKAVASEVMISSQKRMKKR